MNGVCENICPMLSSESASCAGYAGPDRIDGTVQITRDACTGDELIDTNQCTIPSPFGPASITATPRIIEKEQIVTVTAIPNGHMGCVLTGGNLGSQPVGRTETFTVTPVLSANTTFTLTCTDPNAVNRYTRMPVTWPFTASVTVELVPRGFET